MSSLVTGTVAIDNIKTQEASRDNLLGGSGSYASISSSFFSPTAIAGVVGDDFPKEHIETLTSREIGIDDLEIIEGGKTFRWSGEYMEDMNDRETLDVQLNVIENFQPDLTPANRKSRIVLLANMSPQNQIDVLAQCESPDLVLADTMDLWINIANDDLKELLKKIDLLVLNDSEARLYTGTRNLITAGHQILADGPSTVVIKKGEHGALAFARDGGFFTTGAYPLHEVHDPTGAGDTFVGGIAGHLAKHTEGTPGFAEVCSAITYGTVMASFTCEKFGVDRLMELSRANIEERFHEFRGYTQIS